MKRLVYWPLLLLLPLAGLAAFAQRSREEGRFYLPSLLWLAVCPGAGGAQVRITEEVYEGAAHFVVRTKAATYWYDKAGGGLSRLIDHDGKDWIAFKREPWGRGPDSAASAYRGIPNFVFGSEDGGAGHPGFTKCASRKVNDRTITTVSKSGKWQWKWTFADDHARVTMEKTDPAAAYWFLYEGTPGGSYSPPTWYWGNDTGGPRRDLPDFLKDGRHIEPMRWAYFGDDRTRRVLFIAQHERDDIADVFGVMGNTREGLSAPDGMTVFGFGRARNAKCLLTAAPQSFTIGFYQKKITGHPEHKALGQHIGKLLARKH
jgi:hypothetical protein